MGMLTRREVSRQRIDALRSSIGAFRFRPEEVAGAAAIWPPSATFNESVKASYYVMEKLNQSME